MVKQRTLLALLKLAHNVMRLLFLLLTLRRRVLLRTLLRHRLGILWRVQAVSGRTEQTSTWART